jgi:phosphatidylserine decarboxylase
MLNIIIAVCIILILYLLFAKVYFLRDPVRTVPTGNKIISPANGQIVAITKIDKNLDSLKIRKGLIGKIRTMTKFIKTDAVMVSIMMNIHNVHVQRVPIDGKVISVKHNKGKFLNAVKDADNLEWLANENIETIIENKEIGKVKVIQIAGLLARRCVSSLKANEKVLKGEKLGLIKLGSQVSIIMPSNVKLNVEIGQIVTDGETIIAQYDEKSKN